MLVKGLRANNGSGYSMATFLAGQGYPFTPNETDNFVVSAKKQLTLKLKQKQQNGVKPAVEATEELLDCLLEMWQKNQKDGPPQKNKKK